MLEFLNQNPKPVIELSAFVGNFVSFRPVTVKYFIVRQNLQPMLNIFPACCVPSHPSYILGCYINGHGTDRKKNKKAWILVLLVPLRFNKFARRNILYPK